MLSPEDRQAIEGLFDRLRQVERDGPERDPEAEALIREEIARLPGAAYYMAQTVVMQDQALRMAEQRIAELEQQAARRPAGGGLFGGLFGDGGRQGYAEPAGPGRGGPNRARGPWGRDDVYDDRYDRGGPGYRSGGGGFLAGAAQTAMGVAGGVLLGNAIAGMFSAGAAQASELGHDETGADQGGDAGADEQDQGGEEDFGGGDFDTGGDF